MTSTWEANDTSNNSDKHNNDQTDQASDSPRTVIDPQAGNEQYAKEVAANGWTQQVAFDYAKFEKEHEDGWLGAAEKYEWKDDFGEVAPRSEELEKILFGSDHRTKQGDRLEKFKEFEVVVEGPKKLAPIASFERAGLHPVILDNIRLSGFTQPTPIQAYCIPLALTGNDMVAIAQTGSGKTAAYMIPVLSRLMGKAKQLSAAKPDTTAEDYNPRIHKARAEPLVLIVVPTRELAIQIFDEARRLCYRSMLRPCVAYGGMPMMQCINDLQKGCDLLIATPGRLVHLIGEPTILTLKRLKHTIIDEADELLNNDWEEELKKIMAGTDVNADDDHSFMLFSATFPRAAMELANEYLATDHYNIKVGRAGSSHRNIDQQVIWVDGDKKQDALYSLLLSIPPQRTLIFCNSRRAVDVIDDFLYNRGFPTTSIHGQRTQREREDSLRAFRKGHVPILIATGVSARGWDIKDIAHIINYELPSTAYGGIDEYVHRIGRTARIGHVGKAISFYNERNEDMAVALTNTLLECGCDIPDFLTQYVHEDGTAHFDEEEGGVDIGITDTDETTDAAWGTGQTDIDDENTAPAWGASSADASEQLTWGVNKLNVES